ncbi:MAG: hypothetical protein CSB23_04385 [Deltaproteobacteria bacterium]|nr:MAG: hypothetical protein CSB23_04385 [Deltaproteobacteria bacterium]
MKAIFFNRVLLVVMYALMACLFPHLPGAKADKLPLYEYGLAALGARFPHYRGSDEYSTYVLPVPYFVYRGKRLQANREGVRGIFFRYRNIQSALSLFGTPPVPNENSARRGLSRRDGTVEIGPAVRYFFYQDGENDTLYVESAVRGVLSVGLEDGLDIAGQGISADCTLVYKNSSLFSEQKIRYHLSTGPLFGDSRFHSFYYEVDSHEATPFRQSYQAGGGYGGWQLSGSVLKEITAKLQVALYGKWLNTSGAVFADSPLARTTDNYVIGSMLIWKLGESSAREP